MYRFNTVGDSDAVNELRSTQQYTYGRRYNSLRIVHRLKLDQRFRDSRATVHRFRYRLSADLPLAGLKLDTGEFYIVASLETLLNAASADRPEWDERFVLGLGNQILADLKIQLDIEYRIEAFNINRDQRIFVITALVYNL